MADIHFEIEPETTEMEGYPFRVHPQPARLSKLARDWAVREEENQQMKELTTLMLYMSGRRSMLDFMKFLDENHYDYKKFDDETPEVKHLHYERTHFFYFRDRNEFLTARLAFE